MKKLLTAIVASAAIANADISVSVYTGYGFTDVSNGADALLLNAGESALIQLIDAGANGAADAVTAAGAGVFGDDTLLDSYTYTASSDPATDFTGYVYTGGITMTGPVGVYPSGNIFARLYVDTAASVGSLYYDGAVEVAPDGDYSAVPPPAPATSYNFGGDSGVDAADFATVIPEPATIGLLGIAAAGLFTARRKVRV